MYIYLLKIILCSFAFFEFFDLLLSFFIGFDCFKLVHNAGHEKTVKDEVLDFLILYQFIVIHPFTMSASQGLNQRSAWYWVPEGEERRRRGWNPPRMLPLFQQLQMHQKLQKSWPPAVNRRGPLLLWTPHFANHPAKADAVEHQGPAPTSPLTGPFPSLLIFSRTPMYFYARKDSPKLTRWKMPGLSAPIDLSFYRNGIRSQQIVGNTVLILAVIIAKKMLTLSQVTTI